MGNRDFSETKTVMKNSIVFPDDPMHSSRKSSSDVYAFLAGLKAHIVRAVFILTSIDLSTVSGT